ncbi:hypothetical protein MTBBW1_280013 [Desulfamplus magnetovallimortis]|uniref:Transposase n=1 Tax=Desulfamplus magnetovallimortis TaxID=1246637 RepID=A0A1W1HFB5_9BACT|nr:hypothetical protein MTBBW1_280013 [Desulfamplus magnetovallimortis]
MLMAIYCRRQFNETVSIKRVREIRTTILNELHGISFTSIDHNAIFKEQVRNLNAKT